MTLSVREAVVFTLMVFGLGVLAGRWVWTDTVKVIEQAAPAVSIPPTPTSPHGAVMLARTTGEHSKPAQALPKGATVQRISQVTVKPKDCAPVTIDTTIVKDKTGQRIITSSPDGEITGGFDMPTQTMIATIVRHWAAGATYGSDRTYGAFVDRDFGRIRVGAEVQQLQTGGMGGRIKLGFTF